jgi:preprotein translocase subunit SecF
MGKFSRLGNDLYGGRKSIDFVDRKGLWYLITGVLVAAAVAVVVIKGLNFGIEFTGGTEYKVPLPADQITQTSADEIRKAVGGAGVPEAESPIVTTAGESILVQVEELTPEESDQVTSAIREAVQPSGEISQSEISASWGREVAERAGLGVAIFLVLVMLFIGFYFREWKMSVAALVALLHDIAITVGVYSLSGFQVTPSAVTGLLAILGFSLYDTVVVFDKVKENTHEMKEHHQTYKQAANLAVNQTLVRSINTGIVALIPIGAILWVSASQLGASSLQDLALSQFVGMAAGVYSSIVLAPRVLVHLKSGESEVVLAEKRAAARIKAADPYAAVPVFKDNMPVADNPRELAGERVGSDLPPGARVAEGEDGEPSGARADRDRAAWAPVVPPRGEEASGSGRVLPNRPGEVRQSKSAGRAQPTRKSRSKRSK